MRPALEPAVDSRRILALAREDRAAAQRAIASLDLEQQVALVCEAPVARRGELLDLVRDPERLVPALPEAELCFTVKAMGLADAGWILALATDDQIQSCVDLDAWSVEAEVPDRARLGAWLEALAEGGDEALLRTAHALDPELLMLWLRDRADVLAKPGDDPGWQPPAGAVTIDGVFFLVGRGEGEALELALQILDLLFREDYWLYFRLLQAVVWESADDNEEWALRWRSGRLQDLGFPPWEEAAPIYAHPRREELEVLPEAAPPIGEWPLPVWIPGLPAPSESGHSLFRAAAELDPAARRALFYAFVALANKVAVADRLPLGDAESLPRAIEKAARLASLGLDWLAERHGVPRAEVLRRAPPDRLFRIGFRLDRTGGAP